jgi:hypothetical protein
MHPTPLRGEIVHHFAFDIAYEMRREPLTRLLGQPVTVYTVDPPTRNPRQLSFYRPQMVRLPAVERRGPHGPVQVQRTIKILPLGALSVTVRVPVAVGALGDLAAYRGLRSADGTLAGEVRALVEEVRRELAPLLISPHAELVEEVAYTVFVLDGPPVPAGEPVCCEAWLRQHRRAVAGLLLQEDDPARLSAQQVEEATARWLSYSDHDLAVVGWEAALLIEPAAAVEQSLYIMELANLQLAELEAYDRILDQATDRTYRDVRRPTRLLLRRSLHDLRELRIDLARLSDELENITKVFGDWHLARLYGEISGRLHLRDWQRSIDGKLTTIDDLYQLAKQDVHGRWMLVLELSIVLLFIVELVVVFAGRG